MTSGQLLARLLVASSSAVGACAGASSGTSGYPAPTDEVRLAPGPSASSSAPRLALPRVSASRSVRRLVAPEPLLPPGWHEVRPPRPPLTSGRAVPLWSSTSQPPGDEAMDVCGDDYYRWIDNSTGGPFFLSLCYERAAPKDACLEATDPLMFCALGVSRRSPCVSDGPYAQTADGSGAPLCCYNFGQFGEGRPLVVAGGQRWAPLARGAWG